MTKKTYLHLITPLILTSMFFCQFYLVNTHNLTQWKGGGFGMFSTIDSNSSRVLSLKLINNEVITIALMPYELEKVEVINKANFIPSKSLIESLYTAMAKSDWYCEKEKKVSSDSICLFASTDKSRSLSNEEFKFEHIEFNLKTLNLDVKNKKVEMRTVVQYRF